MAIACHTHTHSTCPYLKCFSVPLAFRHPLIMVCPSHWHAPLHFLYSLFLLWQCYNLSVTPKNQHFTPSVTSPSLSVMKYPVTQANQCHRSPNPIPTITRPPHAGSHVLIRLDLYLDSGQPNLTHFFRWISRPSGQKWRLSLGWAGWQLKPQERRDIGPPLMVSIFSYPKSLLKNKWGDMQIHSVNS